MASPIAHDGSNIHDAFRVRDTFERSSADSPFAWTGTLLTGAGLLLMVLSLFRESDVPFSVGLLCVFAVLLLLLAARRGHVLIRSVALFTVMIALFPVAAGSERFLLPVSSDPALYLEEAGSWLALVGGALLLLAGSPRQAGPGLRWVTGLVTILVGMPTVGVPMTLVPNIGHTSADEAPPVWFGEPAPTLGEHAWTWVSEEYGRIVSVVPTPSVGLVLLDKGAVGLDPVTGREVWSYRHPAMGGESTSSGVDPAGKRVRLSFETGPRYKGRIVLEAATGRVLGTTYYRPGRFDGPPYGVRTANGVIRYDRGVLWHEDGVSGGSWEHDPGKRCHTGYDIAESGHVRSVGEKVLVSMVCGYEEDELPDDIDEPDLDGRIAALNLVTGRESWRVSTAYAWPEGHSLPVPRDLRISVDESAVYTPEGDLVVALDTGEVLYEDPEPFWAGAEFVGVGSDSFTVSVRDGGLARYVERDWGGDVVRTTGALTVAEDRPASAALPLGDAVIRMVSGAPGWELAIHPWDDGVEPRLVPMDQEALADSGMNVSGALFVPVHDTVFVHTADERRSRVLPGLR